jgi:hypothetical protein
MRNEIRRELERRRKAINISKGRVVKKSSAAPPPLPRLIPSVSGAAAATMKLGNAPREGAAKKCSARPPHPRVLIPTGPPGATTKKIAYLDMGEAPKRCTAPPRREALIPFTMKVAKSAAPTALIATELPTATSHKKPSSAPIQPGQRSSSISVKKGMTVKVRMPAGTLPTGERLVILHPAVVISDVEDGYVKVAYKGRTERIALDQVKEWRLPADHRRESW